ncbi:DUF892 family protein [Streptomyces sp. NPDC051322]|uniref:YciE/YciF ferroxidase family protein n=1 Tax=Streptomyces sp. NPDC051322 TaxID=3154645 RepID=UPI00344CE3AD
MSERTLQDVFVTYLRDAHALERLIDTALGALIRTTDAPELRIPLEHHRSMTREHLNALADRLHAHEARPSAVKDTGLALAAFGEGLLAKARRDHAGKNARDAYVLIHLAIAGYEMLGHLADRMHDDTTARLIRHHLDEERATAATIDARWDVLLDLSLRHAGVPAAPAMAGDGVR